ncbi:MAG: hypothetical protein J1E34_08580 [Oscillospiraceae bacterium]|nr:hypothetical protein [Oscillospiraceae bacterium]
MDISSILNNLSEDDMEKLRQTAASFFGSEDNKPEAEKNNTALSLPGISPQMLGSVAKISSALSANNPKSDFLYALKPLLSQDRQKKADEAAMMIKLLGVLGMFKGGRQ